MGIEGALLPEQAPSARAAAAQVTARKRRDIFSTSSSVNKRCRIVAQVKRPQQWGISAKQACYATHADAAPVNSQPLGVFDNVTVMVPL